MAAACPLPGSTARPEQETHHIGCGVGITFQREELRDPAEVVARRHQRWFLAISGPHLSEARSGKQAVADAFAALRFFQASTFSAIVFDRFPGTAIADDAVRLAVMPPETTDVADALACRKDRRIGKSTVRLE
jgi:hypothetical protein